MIRLSCDCGAKFEAKEDRAGQSFDCTKCGARIHVPLPDESRVNQIAFLPKDARDTKDIPIQGDASPKTQPSEKCRLHWIGRAFFVAGILFILAGIRGSGSRYESKSQLEVHSFSQSAAKEQMFIVGSAFVIAGTVARCKSSVTTTVWETGVAIAIPFALLFMSLSHFNTAVEVSAIAADAVEQGA